MDNKFDKNDIDYDERCNCCKIHYEDFEGIRQLYNDMKSDMAKLKKYTAGIESLLEGLQDASGTNNLRINELESRLSAMPEIELTQAGTALK